MSKNQLEQMRRELWFNYFNQYLYKRGLISKEQVQFVEKYLLEKRANIN